VTPITPPKTGHFLLFTLKFFRQSPKSLATGCLKGSWFGASVNGVPGIAASIILALRLAAMPEISQLFVE